VLQKEKSNERIERKKNKHVIKKKFVDSKLFFSEENTFRRTINFETPAIKSTHLEKKYF
jgi:hypothetical protein